MNNKLVLLFTFTILHIVSTDILSAQLDTVIKITYQKESLDNYLQGLRNYHELKQELFSKDFELEKSRGIIVFSGDPIDAIIKSGKSEIIVNTSDFKFGFENHLCYIVVHSLCKFKEFKMENEKVKYKFNIPSYFINNYEIELVLNHKIIDINYNYVKRHDYMPGVEYSVKNLPVEKYFVDLIITYID